MSEVEAFTNRSGGAHLLAVIVFGATDQASGIVFRNGLVICGVMPNLSCQARAISTSGEFCE
jgi:hypothetical protein